MSEIVVTLSVKGANENEAIAGLYVLTRDHPDSLLYVIKREYKSGAVKFTASFIFLETEKLDDVETENMVYDYSEGYAKATMEHLTLPCDES